MNAHWSISHRGPEVISESRAAFIYHSQYAQISDTFAKRLFFFFCTFYSMNKFGKCPKVSSNKILERIIKHSFIAKNIVYIQRLFRALNFLSTLRTAASNRCNTSFIHKQRYMCLSCTWNPQSISQNPVLEHDFYGLHYLQFLCCNLEQRSEWNACRVRSQCSPPSTTWYLPSGKFTTYTHTNTSKGAAKGPLPVGGRECWNQPHERIANYCPLGRTQ